VDRFGRAALGEFQPLRPLNAAERLVQPSGDALRRQVIQADG
jgi:hypothetical protein